MFSGVKSNLLFHHPETGYNRSVFRPSEEYDTAEREPLMEIRHHHPHHHHRLLPCRRHSCHRQPRLPQPRRQEIHRQNT